MLLFVVATITLNIADLYTNFEGSSFSHSRDMKEDPITTETRVT